MTSAKPRTTMELMMTPAAASRRSSHHQRKMSRKPFLSSSRGRLPSWWNNKTLNSIRIRPWWKGSESSTRSRRSKVMATSASSTYWSQLLKMKVKPSKMNKWVNSKTNLSRNACHKRRNRWQGKEWWMNNLIMMTRSPMLKMILTKIKPIKRLRTLK